MSVRFAFLPLLLILCFACSSDLVEDSSPIDSIFVNGNIYTVDPERPRVKAIAVSEGRIAALGSNEEIREMTGSKTKIIDLQGQFLMPGFIEGHGHFSGLGSSLLNLNFLKSQNWDEVVSMVEERARTAEPGEWIIGRGWHQEKWDRTPERNIHGYPFHESLSAVSPDNPVMLRHASGHSLYANAKAMELAGISRETAAPAGGEIVRDVEGNAIGVFEERAMRPVMEAHQRYLDELDADELERQWYRAIETAEAECLANGITSFQDAGSSFTEIERYTRMAENGELDLRLWAMLRHPYDTMVNRMEGLRRVGVGNEYFTCRAIKTEVDGALGAFGAWLLEPYHDKPDFVGQNTTEISEVDRIADLALQHDMQLCVHAIGDRANREVLDIMADKFSKTEATDLRWRIEHAQHLNVSDIPRFAELGVIASMQAVHATSDAPFVEKRLGTERAAEGAYAWRSLLDAGVVVTNGTDAPVEDVSPLESFYATVTRRRENPSMEFFPEQAMSREEAVRSYTLSCAYAAFEEDLKGSLEVGKMADFVVLSQDLLTCSDEELKAIQVLGTVVDGKVRYASAGSPLEEGSGE